jgi:hypothetical protein
MKKSELLEMIRTVVKEEVDHALPQLLMEVLAEKIVNSEVSAKPVAPKPAPAPTNYRKPQVALDAPLRSEIKAPAIFSLSSKFGQILNETQGGVPQDDINATPSVIDTVKSIPKEVLNENRDVAAVANAMTRDYSQMLKAIDAKAKAKRPA